MNYREITGNTMDDLSQEVYHLPFHPLFIETFETFLLDRSYEPVDVSELVGCLVRAGHNNCTFGFPYWDRFGWYRLGMGETTRPRIWKEISREFNAKLLHRIVDDRDLEQIATI